MKGPLSRFFLRFVLPHWPLGLGVVLAGLGASAASLPFPLLLRKVIDEVVPKGDAKALLLYGLVLFGLVVVESFLTYAAQALMVLGGEAVLYDAQRALASHVLSLPHQFFQEHTPAISFSGYAAIPGWPRISFSVSSTFCRTALSF
ncbi:MAG: ABC transporter transmembrane domain-containing protein [Candidatus Bipolaricaulaceae bacterium]